MFTVALQTHPLPMPPAHTLGGRAGYKFQCSDVQSEPGKLGNRRGGGFPGSVGATGDHCSAALPSGPTTPCQPCFLRPEPEMTGPRARTHRTQHPPQGLPPCNGCLFLFIWPLSFHWQPDPTLLHGGMVTHTALTFI